MREKRFNQALGHYLLVTQMAPDSLESSLAYHHSARIYAQTGRLPQAIQTYETILERYPKYENLPYVLLEGGRIYAKMENWTKAREWFQRCYDEFPSMRNQVTPHLQYVNQNLESAQDEIPVDNVPEAVEAGYPQK
jgi:tetratricopeptide (TPR) repeat protein